MMKWAPWGTFVLHPPPDISIITFAMVGPLWKHLKHKTGAERWVGGKPLHPLWALRQLLAL